MKRRRSQREDGRGHWPRGGRRHADAPVGRWPRVSLLSRTVVAYAAEVGRSEELAEFCGTWRKTLWRWRTGEDLPGPRFASRLLKWAHREGVQP